MKPGLILLNYTELTVICLNNSFILEPIRELINGGSIENRARFLFEVVDHLSTIVDPSKLAIRLSPLNNFQVPGINPTAKEDYSYIIAGLQKEPMKVKVSDMLMLLKVVFT